MPGITLSELLKKMIEMGGSDLHITTNSCRRALRVSGRLPASRHAPLDGSGPPSSLAYSVFDGCAKAPFRRDLELDFSFG